jgi:hypothetical protein
MRKVKPMRKALALAFAVLTLLAGIAYILAAHTQLSGALAVIGTALGLCVVASLS